MIGTNDGSFGDDLEKEIGLLLREQRRQEPDDLERELNLYRSGSAPPTVEGSLTANDKVRGSTEWGGDGLIGLPGLGLGSKQKSLAEIFQDDLGRATPVTRQPSRPANAFNENVESVATAEAELAHLRCELSSAGSNGQGSSAVQNIGPPTSYSYAAAVVLASMMAGQLGTGNLPMWFENVAAASALAYLRTPEYAAAQLAALNDPSVDRNYLGNYMNLLELQNAHVGALFSSQKSHYGVPMGGKSGVSNHRGYYGNPAFGVGLSYPGRGIMAMAQDGGVNMDESFASSLLEEFKSNKTKCLEFSEIAGHVVEFRLLRLFDLEPKKDVEELEACTAAWKPHERSAIIKELAGKIVQMSQQKFASNVVEKCLTFGGPSERELLAMMKDQFANYVVQKVLETCDDQQRELILMRIKVHLNALKKYTLESISLLASRNLLLLGSPNLQSINGINSTCMRSPIDVADLEMEPWSVSGGRDCGD
ncbi:hypothetical protein GH714_027091 [Hevea brasiliensis]|uniref:Nucleic acid binding NABP domain-containing protein n=1 Tax=Hevea brasiliensis TaxID=3981 RepID=A0A6A6MG30_HEVBR|nr:hypothetical protein GH714_027091 [Hevea brasiliensis]